jgi:hypothetical protein
MLVSAPLETPSVCNYLVSCIFQFGFKLELDLLLLQCECFGHLG